MFLFRRTGLYVLPLFLGLLFFATSLTPTLIPREWFMQGLLGGIVMALGYLIGRAGISIWRLMEIPEPNGRILVITRVVVGVPVAIYTIWCLWQARDWQNGIRSRMDMQLADNAHTERMVLVALLVFAALVLSGYIVKWLFDWLRFRLYRYLPARTANVVGFVLTAFLLLIITRDGVLDRVITGLDNSVTVAQNLFDTAPPIPPGIVTGGMNSLVDWEALGEPGRDYVTSGPDAEDIAAFTKRAALDPIRVYVGRAQGETPTERAEIALAELIRQNGFARKVLIVALPTGTGWLDPGSMDPVEYMHGGDIATVAVQYSYLQSPLALMLETRSGLEQAAALIDTLHRYWRDLPEDARPRLYLHGLSLGAWASMYGTDLFALLNDPIDGAFWVGPPFPSTLWQTIVASRNADSPYIAPVLGDGRLIRFASHTDNDAGGPDGWGDMRIVFLQYASDPIVFYEPASLFRAPVWMSEPPGADVSPDMRFMPVVTQFQLAIDMALANNAPVGHGHAYYGPDYVGPWVAVSDPENWTASDTARLKAHCDGGFDTGCALD